MTNPFDIALIIGIATIVLLLIIVILGLLCLRPKTVVVRPYKAPQTPAHGVYRARRDCGDLQVNPHRPKAPKGAEGGS